jgi:hypothetical protein
MNLAQQVVDVRTIAVHEQGHSSGLNHPDVCGAMTQAEVDAVMFPDGRYKPNTNSDDRAGVASLY